MVIYFYFNDLSTRLTPQLINQQSAPIQTYGRMSNLLYISRLVSLNLTFVAMEDKEIESVTADLELTCLGIAILFLHFNCTKYHISPALGCN